MRTQIQPRSPALTVCYTGESGDLILAEALLALSPGIVSGQKAGIAVIILRQSEEYHLRSLAGQARRRGRDKQVLKLEGNEYEIFGSLTAAGGSALSVVILA